MDKQKKYKEENKENGRRIYRGETGRKKTRKERMRRRKDRRINK